MTSTVSEQSFPNETTICAIPEQLSSDMNGEAVILDLQSGGYYGLNEVGSFIWQFVQERKTIGEVRTAVLNEFEVAPDICDRDLTQLIKELESKHLITVVHEKVAKSTP